MRPPQSNSTIELRKQYGCVHLQKIIKAVDLYPHATKLHCEIIYRYDHLIIASINQVWLEENRTCQHINIHCANQSILIS